MQVSSDQDDGGDSSGSYPGEFPGCKALALSFAPNFAACLINPPSKCKYRLTIDASSYCFHPNRDKIIERHDETDEE